MKAAGEQPFPYVWGETLPPYALASLPEAERAKYDFVQKLAGQKFFDNIAIDKVYYLILENRLWHFVIPASRAEKQSFIASSIALLESFADLKGWQWSLLKGLLRSIDFDRVVLPNFLAATHTEFARLSRPAWEALRGILKKELPGYTFRWSVIYSDELVQWLREGKDALSLETLTAEVPATPAAYEKIRERYRKKYANGLQKALDAGLISSEVIRSEEAAARLSEEDVQRIVAQYQSLYNVKYNKGNAASFNADYVRFLAGRYSHLLIVRDPAQQVVGGIFYRFAFFQHYLINWVFYDAAFNQSFRSGGATLYTYIMFQAVLDVLEDKLRRGDERALNISNGVLDYKSGNFYASVYKEQIIFDFSQERSPLRRLVYRFFAADWVQRRLRGS